MGSLTKDPRGRSPYWFVAYRDGKGRRHLVSTKQTERKKADDIRIEIERAEEQARRGAFTEAQARKLATDIYERAAGESLSFQSAREWLKTWLATKDDEKAKATGARYSSIVNGFLAHLGEKADASLAHVTPKHLQTFRAAERAAGKSATTCNFSIGVLRAAFAAAKRQGFIGVNPVEALQSLPTEDGTREAFTSEQIQAILAAAVGERKEWRLLVLLGYYAGGRLQDMASLKGGSVDRQKRLIAYTQAKTGARVTIPLHAEIEAALPSTAGKDDFLSPSLAGRDTSSLSASFKRLMEAAGIDQGRVKAKGAAGRSVSTLSFHSLRHSFNSAMANAGVRQEIRQQLTGHATAAANSAYTHLDVAPLRTAIDSIPVV